MHDSMVETFRHIQRVQHYINKVAQDLTHRAEIHDQSKLESPEVEIFAEMTHKLKSSTYGSEEYNGFLAQMKPALDHHYAANRHHPEHWENGVNDMTLMDLMEMLCDWKAASERHANGDIMDSILKNVDRFKLSPQLQSIFENTAKELFLNQPEN